MNIRSMKRLVVALTIAGLAGLAPLTAQPMGGPGRGGGMHGPGMRGPDAMGPGEMELRRELFPPELVMRHQTEIGLTEDQKKSLIREMQSLQSDLVPLQFDMSEAAGRLRDALAAPRIDEPKAGALADTLMTLESRIKRRHLALMIRVKNILTPEQQTKLRELRDEARDRRREQMEQRRGGHPGGPDNMPDAPDEPGTEPGDSTP